MRKPLPLYLELVYKIECRNNLYKYASYKISSIFLLFFTNLPKITTKAGHGHGGVEKMVMRA